MPALDSTFGTKDPLTQQDKRMAWGGGGQAAKRSPCWRNRADNAGHSCVCNPLRCCFTITTETTRTMSSFFFVAVLAAAASACPASAVGPTRVLFVGNSFTFVNDLPHQLANIATSLGQDVVVANSTIGGCTIYHQVRV